MAKHSLKNNHFDTNSLKISYMFMKLHWHLVRKNQQIMYPIIKIWISQRNMILMNFGAKWPKKAIYKESLKTKIMDTLSSWFCQLGNKRFCSTFLFLIESIKTSKTYQTMHFVGYDHISAHFFSCMDMIKIWPWII